MKRRTEKTEKQEHCINYFQSSMQILITLFISHMVGISSLD